MNIFFDPNKKFSHVNQHDAVAHNQLLLEWATLYDRNNQGTLEEHMQQCYSFPICTGLKEKTKLNDDFSFKYPGDPAQHPIFVVDFGQDCRFIIYQHAMVVFVQDGKWDIGRMD